MSERADEELAALVRWVLPPRRPEWRVQVVDNPEEACAIFAQNLLRVQRYWREVVYDAGLHFVTMHYPLSLDRMRPVRRRGARVAVDVWRATAIRRDEKRGLTEVRGHVARTVAGSGVAFGDGRSETEQLALAAAGLPPSPVLTARARARRDARRRAMLQELASRTRYEGGFRVAMATYERWFPRHKVEMFMLFEGGVPLVAVVNETFDILPDLEDHEFEDLMSQLRWDMEKAEPELMKLAPGPNLAPEEDAVLWALAP